jgi:hypothetical protein
MATYVNDLRLKEITTGDESGTWGTSTNTNLSLIADAFSLGVKQLAADANETFTMPDAVADGTRSLYLRITSAVSLSSTRTVTLGPNTVSKVWIIENLTTGGQSIVIAQGTGSTVTVANGAKVLVATDGAGAGAAVINATLTPPTINLGTGVTGTLAVPNGGTGQTSYTNGQLLIGNTTGNTLVKSTLTAGTGITITNGSGSITISTSGGGGTVTSVGSGTGLTGGPITTSGTLAVATNGITDTLLRQSAGLSLIGRSADTTGNVADVVAASDHQILRRSGTSLGFGAIALNQPAAITGALPVGNGGTGQTSFTNGELLIGNTTGNTLSKGTLTAGSGITITNGGGTITIAAVSGGGGTVTSVGSGTGLTGGPITTSGTLAVATNGITDTLLRQSLGLSVLGRSASATGNVADITAGTDHQVLRRSGAALEFGAVALNQPNAITGALPVGNGGTGATTLTANAYLKGNGTSAVTAQTGIPAGDITSGTLGVARGGTGATTLTANNVILGNGTSAPLFVAPSTSGNVLTSNGTTWQSTAPAVTATSTTTFTNKTLEKAVLNDGYTEEVFAITDGSTVNLDPNNGSIQTWTLGASRTPGQANWASGQSITLLVNDGTAYAITWSTLSVVWKTDNGAAPTLNTTGFTVIVLWKVSTTIYGARVGDA